MISSAFFCLWLWTFCAICDKIIKKASEVRFRMNNSVKFRNSVKGYNKQDVIEYIAELSAEHDEARAQYETELARAHREAETEKEAAKISEAKADELATELYAALERERELKRSVSGLSARIAAYEKEKAARKATVKQKVKKTLFKKQK